MERFRKIIEKGKVELTNVGGGIINFITGILVLVACLYALYKLNHSSKPRDDQPVDFFNIVFVLLIILCIYILILCILKLKIKLYKDNNPVEKKKLLIERFAEKNKWKLIKAETNYYLYWENNWIFGSYYVTLVVDDKGFYINSYPFYKTVLDFGASQRNSDEIYEELRELL